MNELLEVYVLLEKLEHAFLFFGGELRVVQVLARRIILHFDQHFSVELRHGYANVVFYLDLPYDFLWYFDCQSAQGLFLLQEAIDTHGHQFFLEINLVVFVGDRKLIDVVFVLRKRIVEIQICQLRQNQVLFIIICHD